MFNSKVSTILFVFVFLLLSSVVQHEILAGSSGSLGHGVRDQAVQSTVAFFLQMKALDLPSVSVTAPVL